jgi:hypothetical protein
MLYTWTNRKFFFATSQSFPSHYASVVGGDVFPQLNHFQVFGVGWFGDEIMVANDGSKFG